MGQTASSKLNFALKLKEQGSKLQTGCVGPLPHCINQAKKSKQYNAFISETCIDNHQHILCYKQY